jgi:hypothetical protein
MLEWSGFVSRSQGKSISIEARLGGHQAGYGLTSLIPRSSWELAKRNKFTSSSNGSSDSLALSRKTVVRCLATGERILIRCFRA